MTNQRPVFVLPALALLSALIALPGCSLFQGSRAIDMTPFAENTSAMFAEAAKVGRPFRFVHLKPYVHIPEAAEFRDRSKPLISALRGIVLYSNQVVALSMADKADKEKNALLADYLLEATGKVATRERLQEIGIGQAAYDSTMQGIRNATTFLDGVAAASPMVNAIVLAVLERLDEMNNDLPSLTGVIDGKIEARYREKRAAYEGLTSIQARYLNAATLLYEARSGDEAVLDSLFAYDASLRDFIPEDRTATRKEFDLAEEDLVGRLGRIGTLISQLEVERQTYLATQQELEDFRINVDQRIKLARDAIVVWGQAHRNLGQGIPVAPMIDIAGMASGLARTALPLP
jgi:hypothetical protein